MGNKKIIVLERQSSLFELPVSGPIGPMLPPLKNPIWTESKAKLIDEYLKLFVFITKHGTYIDGFAGPQEPDKPDMWAARLVLEREPKWLRHFHFFECNRKKIKQLRKLKAQALLTDPEATKRQIEIYPGDCNTNIREWLRSQPIKEKEATFCLLDQRTFECEWETVVDLANYKSEGNKIELFYFLANAWLDRALSAQKDIERLKKWWGRNDWPMLKTMSAKERADAFVIRLKEELGYKYVMAYPIYQRKKAGGNIMYYMIHATDHFEAPLLMSRAYNKSVYRADKSIQLSLGFELVQEAEGQKAKIDEDSLAKD